MPPSRESQPIYLPQYNPLELPPKAESLQISETIVSMLPQNYHDKISTHIRQKYQLRHVHLLQHSLFFDTTRFLCQQIDQQRLPQLLICSPIDREGNEISTFLSGLTQPLSHLNNHQALNILILIDKDKATPNTTPPSPTSPSTLLGHAPIFTTIYHPTSIYISTQKPQKIFDQFSAIIDQTHQQRHLHLQPTSPTQMLLSTIKLLGNEPFCSTPPALLSNLPDSLKVKLQLPAQFPQELE